MIWFTADTHFGHANILGLTDRHARWGSIEEMNRALVANINALVVPTDDLYHLGDFSFKRGVEGAASLRRQIRCRNV
jgi:calcineurin-like phosphoesterase family protein